MATERIYTPAQIRQMAAMGQLGMASGDRVLAPAGREMYRQAGDLMDTTALQDSKDASLASEERYRQALQDRWNQDRETDVAESAKERALRLKLERMGIDADFVKAAITRSSEDLKAGSSAEQKARQAERLAAKATELKTTMPKGAVRENMDVLGSLVSGFNPAIGQRFINSHYDANQNKWRSDADSFDQDLSNLAAGLAVTGFELENKQKWSPRAPGITAKEAQDRFDNINRKFSEMAQAARGQLPGQSRSGPRNRRNVGGVTYVQVGPDEWEPE